MSIASYKRSILAHVAKHGHVAPDDIPKPANIRPNQIGPVWSGLHRQHFIRPIGVAHRSRIPSRKSSFTADWVIDNPDWLAAFERENPAPPAPDQTLFDSLPPNKKPSAATDGSH